MATGKKRKEAQAMLGKLVLARFFDGKQGCLCIRPGLKTLHFDNMDAGLNHIRSLLPEPCQGYVTICDIKISDEE